MDNLYLALTVIFPLFCMMSLGYFLQRINVLDKPFVKKLNLLCFNAFLPLVIFLNIYNSDFYSLFSPKLVIFGMASVTVAFIALMIIVPKFVEEDINRGVVIQGIFRSNFVLFGVPIAISLYGSENAGTAAILTAFIVPLFNLYSVVALNLFSGTQFSKIELVKKICKNPLIIGAMVAFLFVFTGFRMPSVLESTIADIAAIATPLALITLGGSFQFGDLKKFKELLTISVFGKLVIIPVIFLSIAILLGFRDVELASLMIMLASPTAVASFTMAQSVNANDELAGQIVVMTSLFSIFTIVCWISVLKNFGFM
ncbi:MAG: hypothetical protein BEN18_10495 [Epulopiscium sp. Nuni2H_MBin001]|nr:MAG: hypothetical protein BEN18_10495 [Epulopiscium sp. Nuni2H_MBin001]